MTFRKETLAEGVEMILGDNRELLMRSSAPKLPAIELCNAVVTDPPYGIGASSMNMGKWRTSRMEKGDWDNVRPDLGNILAIGVPSIIWGGNYFGLPASRAFLVWNKGAGFRGRDFAECEMAWCSFDGNARVIDFDPLARGSYRDKQHPTQKPVEVMEWCLECLPNGARRILDPYAGSGSTGVAAIRLGLQFTGIEINEGYFDIACRRIDAALKEPSMFIETPAPLKQTSMFSDEAA